MSDPGDEFHKVYIGNFGYDTTVEEVEAICDKYGELHHVDMKTGFCFCYFFNKSDAEACIDDLDGQDGPGRPVRTLKVQWARGDGRVKIREDSRRRNVEPNSTLFVVNFDTATTREADLEDHFGKYGKLKRVQIKNNFAFIQFEELEDAKEAKNQCHGQGFQKRVLTVEYVANNAGERDRDRSPPPRRFTPPRSYGRRDDYLRGPPRGRDPYDRGYDRDRGYNRGYDRGRDPYDRGYDRRDRSPIPRRRSPSPRGYGRRSPPAYRRSMSPYRR